MKIIFTSFLFLLIISSALNSDCTDKKATDSPTSSSTDSGNPSGPSQPASTDDSSNNEENPSEEGTEEDTDTDTDTTRLRILSSLTDDDCKNLKTSDDKKYQCVVSSDKSKCEEVEKESSSLLYLSLTYLIIFVIL